MGLHYRDLDDRTRHHMLIGYEEELASENPYVSGRLSDRGRDLFPELMREAIRNGTDESLRAQLNDARLWRPGSSRDAAQRLAYCEFNTFYVRGLAYRLQAEHEHRCEIYRAGPAYAPRALCRSWEGVSRSIADVLAGHRRHYHGDVDVAVLSIPVGANCHHTIGRCA